MMNRLAAWCGVIVTGLCMAGRAQAAPSVTVTAAAPMKAGNISLRFFHCADAECSHGTPCTVGPFGIQANLTAAQKAAMIESEIDNANCGDVVRTDNVLTITLLPNGLKCHGATDSTGEVMLVDNDSTGIPVDYRTCTRLTGTPTSGTARTGENGISHTVTTGGKTISQIYTEWQSMFAEGTIEDDRFCLPRRDDETFHSFEFEVTDPGLEVAVDQALTREITFQQGLTGYSGCIDTFMDQAAPMATNCDSESLSVQCCEQDEQAHHAVIRFDGIVGMSPPQIPPGVHIIDAVLMFATSDAADISVNLAELVNPLETMDCDCAWDSCFGGDGVQPDDMEAGSMVQSFAPPVSGVVAFDVAESVQTAACGGGLNGWALLPGDETSDQWAAASCDAAVNNTRPRLQVVFDFLDSDGDARMDGCDNCQFEANTNQADMDDDGVGDVCDPDRDGDGVDNDDDNCPDDPNPGQEDCDDNDVGDICQLAADGADFGDAPTDNPDTPAPDDGYPTISHLAINQEWIGDEYSDRTTTAESGPILMDSDDDDGGPIVYCTTGEYRFGACTGSGVVGIRVRTSADAEPGVRYLNVVLDMDGDYVFGESGVFDIDDADEWVVQNEPLDMGPSRTERIIARFPWLLTPRFDPTDAVTAPDPIWIRATVTREPVLAWDSGEQFCYGETEDHRLIPPPVPPPPPDPCSFDGLLGNNPVVAGLTYPNRIVLAPPTPDFAQVSLWACQDVGVGSSCCARPVINNCRGGAGQPAPRFVRDFVNLPFGFFCTGFDDPAIGAWNAAGGGSINGPGKAVPICGGLPGTWAFYVNFPEPAPADPPGPNIWQCNYRYDVRVAGPDQEARLLPVRRRRDPNTGINLSSDMIYVSARCGNTMHDAGEVCDQSAGAAPANGCPLEEKCLLDCSDCTECGDSQVSGPETCDQSANPNGCAAGEICLGCTRCTTCGNGVFPNGGENCDQSDVAGNGCLPGEVCIACTWCINPVAIGPWIKILFDCWNLLLDAGEFCDPPLEAGLCAEGVCNLTCDGCMLCGDGLIDPSEACDPTAEPTGCGSGLVCLNDCTGCEPGTMCGNGAIDAGEVCDAEADPSGCDVDQVCAADCQSCEMLGACCRNGVCTNGVRESNCTGELTAFFAQEVCLNVPPCPQAVCGDGVVEGSEQCDPGPPVQDSNCPGLCEMNCTCPASFCGNDIIDLGEECDGTQDAACPGDCLPPGDPDECQCGGDAPEPPSSEPGGVNKNRFLGLVIPPAANRGPGTLTAIRLTLATLNHRRLCCAGQDGSGFGTGCNANAPCNADPNCFGGTPLCRHQLAPGMPDYSSMEGNIRYVNSFPGGNLVCPDDGPPFNTTYRCATLGCEPEYRDWATDLGVAVNPPAAAGLVYITGDALVPSSTLHVQHISASCGATPGANTCDLASSALAVGTANWGDISSSAFGPPDGRADVLDIPAVTNKLKGVPTIFPEYRVWLKQRDPAANMDAITVVDLSDVQDAVLSKPYPASRTPDACPHD